MTEDEADKLVQTMFDEDRTVEMVNGKPRISDEQTIREMEAKELEEAFTDFVRSWREFEAMRPEMATDYGRPGILWWRALQFLALAESNFKEKFIQGDRSPRSIQQFHRFKLKMASGRRYQTEA
jgi:hypothetical protein